MKPLISLMALLTVCVSMLGADTGVAVFTTAQTNAQTGSVYVRDVFTRDGQTNLVRVLKKNSQGMVWFYRFYHASQLVGNFVALAEESSFNTEATPYCMTLKYGPGAELRSAKIGDKEGLLLDEFCYTNGVFVPVQGPLTTIGLMKPKFASEGDLSQPRSP